MKKKIMALILAAGVFSGSCFIYAGRGMLPYILAGVLCYLASVSAAVLIHHGIKGITGKRLRRAQILTVVLSVPLVVCTVASILHLCSVRTLIPPQMTSCNWHPEFSFKEDKEIIDMDSPLVKTGGFVNFDEAETEFTFYDSNAFERAKLELGDDSPVVFSYTEAYDKAEDVWRIQFHRQDSVTLHEIRFATVYLTGKGITLLIVYDE